MKQIEIITNIDTLIELRLGYIQTEIELSMEEKAILIPKLRAYFENAKYQESFVAYALVVDGEIVSAAFLLIDVRPPGMNNLNGTYGTIMNVFTYSKYRKKGYAAELMQYLIDDSRNRSITILDLYATNDGEPLYEKLGFKIIDYAAMRLKLA